jgi:trk system potassium uptake protein TrkH
VNLSFLPSRVFRHPARLVLAAFVGAIAIGAGLLSLPVASVPDGPAPLETAFFTATSAVTVTGLVTVDTATYWTPFGQVVILGLIQIGGLGIMTSVSLLLLVAAKSIGLRGRLATQTETHTLDLGDLRRLVVTIVGVSLAVELVVAVVLTTRLVLSGSPLGDAAWEGAFHAVSSFNNAGFSLYSDNLMGLATDGWFLVTIALAVIVGGMGFPVWLDLFRRLRRPATWSVHTKLTLLTTAALLVAGTVVLTALEWGNDATLGELGWRGRLLNGFMAGVMPRTAGFNTIDYAEAGDASLLVTDMLMFAGGGSGGTAGGIKVTTLAVLFLVVWAELRGDVEPTAFRRRMPGAAIRQAFTVAVIAINIVVVATLALMLTNDLRLSIALFECVSAFATVGLSTGITPSLDVAGQAILMPLMLLGRVGPITLFVALVLRERELRYRHPEERPLIG